MADNLTKAQRRLCMSHVRNKDTDLERLVRSEVHRLGLRFRKHATHLPGSPDLVFPAARVAIFIDGDFWHGWRFPVWRNKVSEFWQAKISKNRDRDRKNFARLRRKGWRVIRLWQHEIDQDFDSCIEKIVSTVRTAGERPQS